MSRIIEEETGRYSGKVHQHNGYFAGDFSGQPVAVLRFRSAGVPGAGPSASALRLS